MVTHISSDTVLHNQSVLHRVVHGDNGLHGMVEVVVEPVVEELHGKTDNVKELVMVNPGDVKSATPNPATVRIKFMSVKSD